MSFPCSPSACGGVTLRRSPLLCRAAFPCSLPSASKGSIGHWGYSNLLFQSKSNNILLLQYGGEVGREIPCILVPDKSVPPIPFLAAGWVPSSRDVAVQFSRHSSSGRTWIPGSVRPHPIVLAGKHPGTCPQKQFRFHGRKIPQAQTPGLHI